MAERSKIEWTDATFNPWIGCTKVGPGCDHCYAEALMDTRHHRVKWGAGNPRSRTSAANWKLPLRWNKTPFVECKACGWRGDFGDVIEVKPEIKYVCPGCGSSDIVDARRRVFCASLADVFDNEVDPQWLCDLWNLMAATPNLDWLLLTKRISNAHKCITHAEENVLPNVSLGATIVNREEMLRDAEKLMEVPARTRFWSVEPMLGDLGEIPAELLPDWVIAGGESGHHARPSHPGWFRSLRDQCAAADVPFLFKQWGEFAPVAITREEFLHPKPEHEGELIAGPVGGAFEKYAMRRVGKKVAGRLLDGVEHNGFPT